GEDQQADGDGQAGRADQHRQQNGSALHDAGQEDGDRRGEGEAHGGGAALEHPAEGRRRDDDQRQERYEEKDPAARTLRVILLGRHTSASLPFGGSTYTSQPACCRAALAAMARPSSSSPAVARADAESIVPLTG